MISASVRCWCSLIGPIDLPGFVSAVIKVEPLENIRPDESAAAPLSKQQADSEAQNDSNRLVVVGYVLSTFKLSLINV